MIRNQSTSGQDSPSVSQSVSPAKLAIFAIPKLFEGHIGTIQRNAIRSWAQLQPDVEIFLFGQDDLELEKIANEVDAKLLPLRTNEAGTPILGDAFRSVHQNATCDVFCYVNSDIVFGSELLEVASELHHAGLESFLGIGQRINLSIVGEVAVKNAEKFKAFWHRALNDGKIDSVVCKDYFLFSASLFQQIPDFLVGRGNWDNWMVADTKSKGIPVVDLTSRLPAIHQKHDHSHVPGGRKNAYVFGAEAKENQRLAGGRNLIFGSTPTWELTEKGPKKRRFPLVVMIRDLPKFMTLVRNLTFLGYLLAGTAFTC